jgi:hypothetical protein
VCASRRWRIGPREDVLFGVSEGLAVFGVAGSNNFISLRGRRHVHEYHSEAFNTRIQKGEVSSFIFIFLFSIRDKD